MSIQAREGGPARLPERPAQPTTGQPGTGQPGAGAAIEAHDLVKTYPKDVRALDGLSITVPPGTVFGLLGPNGAGKSTTVKILTTLARPDSGSAAVAGLDVARRPQEVRRLIGVVAQRSGADPSATGRENLLLSGRIQGLRGPGLGRRVDELLGRFGLGEAAGRMVRTYSGGMRRRLDVAMGLVHRPGVLFLDEPTAGLDPESRAAMWAEIGRLSAAEGLTILLTTHYLEEADRLAGHLAIVDRGRVVAQGSPGRLKDELHGDTVEVELAAPADPAWITGLLSRLPVVREVRVAGRRVSARAGDGATAVPTLLTALDHAGIAVRGVTAARPTLDDVYLRFTGRRLAEAEETGETRETRETGEAGEAGPPPGHPAGQAGTAAGGTR